VQIAGVISGTAFVGMVLYGEAISVAKIIAIVMIIAGAIILEHAPEMRAGIESEILVQDDLALQAQRR
jgi:hypothetical protein